MVDGYGSGSGYGSDYGSGSGSGYGSGYGYGSDYGSGYGSGSGSGYGYGSGSGDENECREFLSLIAHLLNGKKVLAEPNAELRRIMIECIGSDKFFHDIEGIAKHEDVDGHGNPRRLVRIPMPDTEAGYLQAVHVVCPSTGREYYLGVMPGIDNCQDAVASTFGLTGQEYQPVRES